MDLNGRIKCPECRGSGELHTSHSFECSYCKGVGSLTQEEYSAKREAQRKQDEYREKHRQAMSRISSLHLDTLQEILRKYCAVESSEEQSSIGTIPDWY